MTCWHDSLFPRACHQSDTKNIPLLAIPPRWKATFVFLYGTRGGKSWQRWIFQHVSMNINIIAILNSNEDNTSGQIWLMFHIKHLQPSNRSRNKKNLRNSPKKIQITWVFSGLFKSPLKKLSKPGLSLPNRSTTTGSCQPRTTPRHDVHQHGIIHCHDVIHTDLD